MKFPTATRRASGALLTFASVALVALPFTIGANALLLPLCGIAVAAFTVLIAARDYAPRLSYRVASVTVATVRASQRLPLAA